jgi:hypothetical protein
MTQSTGSQVPVADFDDGHANTVARSHYLFLISKLRALRFGKNGGTLP